MSEPIDDPNSNEPCRELLSSLREIKPRDPQLDWDTILSAKTSDGSLDAVTIQRPLTLIAAARRSAAWLSGIAIGAAITFFVMDWFVLSDLRAKIKHLEQMVASNAENAVANRTILDQDVPSSDVAIELNDVLDSPTLTLALYRGGQARLRQLRTLESSAKLSTKQNVIGSQGPTNEKKGISSRVEIVSEDEVKSQKLLLKEFETKID
jgi:hypothetical protein